MQRCGSSHGNSMSRCPCNSQFHTQPNSFSMLLSMPFDHEPLSTAVDCTLSLGTPSTRVSCDTEKRSTNRACVTNFCWDLLHRPFQTPTFPQNSYKIGHESFNCVNGDGSDPLLGRRCANCNTTSTPLWRNGPRGPKSLCNACGIRFKKEERRAVGVEVTDSDTTDPQRMWVPLSHSQKVPSFSPAIGKDSGAGVPLLSWHLNVTETPSLLNNFTR